MYSNAMISNGLYVLNNQK